MISSDIIRGAVDLLILGCLAEAPSYGKPVNAFDKNSKGAQAYNALAQEILERVSA